MGEVRLKSDKDIAELRVSGKILTAILEALKDAAKEGVTLLELERKTRDLLREYGAKPAFLGYKSKSDSHPFPAAICVSVNEAIVHGVPSRYALKKGDVLKIDCGVDYKGYLTDAALTVGIGEITDEARRLICATEEALAEAIRYCAPEYTLGDIGAAIEGTAKKYGFSVAEKLTGHGVGFAVHEPPSVYNFGERGKGMDILPGMVLAIEPMFSTGSGAIETGKDGACVLKDGSLGAHSEKTVAVTEKGALVLTPWKNST